MGQELLNWDQQREIWTSVFIGHMRKPRGEMNSFPHLHNLVKSCRAFESRSQTTPKFSSPSTTLSLSPYILHHTETSQRLSFPLHPMETGNLSFTFVSSNHYSCNRYTVPDYIDQAYISCLTILAIIRAFAKTRGLMTSYFLFKGYWSCSLLMLESNTKAIYLQAMLSLSGGTLGDRTVHQIKFCKHAKDDRPSGK